MNFMIPFLMAALPAASVAQSQSSAGSGVPSVEIQKTTAVLVVETPRQGVTPQQIMALIPDEIQATVKLYLDGKIREWYSRGDGKGVIFLLDVKTEDEARALMETLAARQGTVNESRVHSGWASYASEGIEPGSFSVMLCHVSNVSP